VPESLCWSSCIGLVPPALMSLSAPVVRDNSITAAAVSTCSVACAVSHHALRPVLRITVSDHCRPRRMASALQPPGSAVMTGDPQPPRQR
jgi:hypothetical protein